MTMNPAHCTCTPDTVRQYLLAAYDVDEVTVRAALANPESKDTVRDAVKFGSHAYYAGDKIATAHGWNERADYDIDEEDDDDDDLD